MLAFAREVPAVASRALAPTSSSSSFLTKARQRIAPKPADTSKVELSRLNFTISLEELFKGTSDPIPIGRPQNYLLMEKKYGTSAWVYICTRRKALDLSSAPFIVSKRTKQGDLTPLGPEHDLARRLRKANPWMTMPALLRITSVWLDLTGNAFWLIQRGPDGLPFQFFPINPIATTIYGDAQSPARMYRVWHFGRDFYAPAFQPGVEGQILHFKTESPLSDLDSAFPSAWGIGPLEAAWSLIVTDEDAVRWNRNLVKNDGRPSGMLISDQEVNEEESKAAAEQYRQTFGGPDGAGKILVLGRNLKYVRIGDTPKDLDYSNSRLSLREEIIATLGLKPVVIGLAQGDVGRRDEEVRDYWQGTVVGMSDAEILPPLNEFIASSWGDDIVIGQDWSSMRALQENEAVRSGWVKNYWSMGIPLNNLIDKFKLGFEHVEGGDIGLVPVGVQPVETAAHPPEPPALPAGPPGAGGGNGMPALRPPKNQSTVNANVRERAKPKPPAALPAHAPEEDDTEKFIYDTVKKAVSDVLAEREQQT